MPLVAVYTASKMAIEGFTASLALELESFGVHVKRQSSSPPACGSIACMAQDNDSLERAIVAALRSTIYEHGPITATHVGSAAKRILGQIARLRGDGLARSIGDGRFAGTTVALRSAELKRRAAVRHPKAVVRSV